MAAVLPGAAHRVRNILLGILGFLVVAFAVCEALGWRFIREPAEKLISRRTETPVEIGEPFRLHLLGGITVKAGSLRIAAPPGFDLPHFLDARDIEVKLRYGDLWDFKQTGALRVASLDVGQIDVRLLRKPDGSSSWQLGERKPSGTAQPPAMDRLSVRQGTARYDDPLLEANLSIRFDTQEGKTNQASISHAEVKGSFRKLPFNAQLTVNGWLPAADREAAQPVAAKGWLDYGGVQASFDGEVKGIFGTPAVKGTMAVKGSSLGLIGRLIDKPLPTTPPFSLRGTVAGQAEELHFDVDDAHIGSSRLAGRFTLSRNTAVPRLEGELRGTQFMLADLAPAFGTRDDFGKPIEPPSGRTIPDQPLNLPTLKKLDAHVEFDIERVDLGKAFAQPIAPLKAELILRGGKLTLDNITARTAKGRLNGMISVDANPEVPIWRANLDWDDIHLQDWLKSAKAQGTGKKQSAPPYFTGTLHGRAILKGSGHSTAKLIGSLNGEVTAFVRRGTLSHLVVEVLGLDVAQGLGLALTGDETLPVQCAAVDLQARNGQLTPRVALIDTPVTLILANGRIDLDRERLDLRIVARPKNVSPFTLRAPIDIQGTFQKPRAAPEAGPIAARVLGGVVLGIINPLAAIIPFIDPGDEQESPCRRSLAAIKR